MKEREWRIKSIHGFINRFVKIEITLSLNSLTHSNTPKWNNQSHISFLYLIFIHCIWLYRLLVATSKRNDLNDLDAITFFSIWFCSFEHILKFGKLFMRPMKLNHIRFVSLIQINEWILHTQTHAHAPNQS